MRESNAPGTCPRYKLLLIFPLVSGDDSTARRHASARAVIRLRSHSSVAAKGYIIYSLARICACAAIAAGMGFETDSVHAGSPNAPSKAPPMTMEAYDVSASQ